MSQPYTGSATQAFLIHDQLVARACASDPAPTGFQDWEDVTEGHEIFPEHFEWASWIDKKLLNSNFLDVWTQNPNLESKLTEPEAKSTFFELVQRDIRVILHCYANDHFPAIWRMIIDAYLSHGLPCGWSGKYPQGRLTILCCEPKN